MLASARPALACVVVLLAAGAARAQAPGATPATAGPPGAPPAAAGARHEKLRADLRARAARPEAIAALGALLRLEDALAPGTLAPTLAPVASDRRTHPLVAAQLEHRLAREAERTGDLDGARRRWQALGFSDDHWVLGPFDAQGSSGLGRAYGPEEQGLVDPTRPGAFAGKEREVSWRRAAPESHVQGALVLDALLRPDTDAVAYVLTVVHAARPGRAVLRLGTPGPARVWLAGQPVFERSVVRPAAVDQDAVEVTLARGPNVLVVKTVVGTAAWRLWLRFTDAAGRPLAGLRWDARAPAPVKLQPGPPRAPRAPTLASLLAARAARASAAQKGEALLDQAYALALLRAEDEEAKVLDRLLEEALGKGAPLEAAALLGEVGQEDDARRDALERVAREAVDPRQRALALAGLGDLARARRREAAAVASWRQALALDPGCWPAVLSMASEELAAGLPAAALARLDHLPAGVRAIVRVRRGRVRALEALGRRQEAEAELRAIAEADRADVEALQQLAGALRARGAGEEAATLYERAATLRPELSYLVMEAARLRDGLGQPAAAARLLDTVVARLPDEPRLHEERGKRLARQGDLPGALAAVTRALELRPQNPTLRRYAERLRAEAAPGDDRPSTDDLARAHAEDAEPVVRAALAEAAGGAEAAVVWLDKHVVRVHRNGLSETFTQRLVHVRADRGVRDHQEFLVRYTPGDQEVEIRKARVFRAGPDGELEIVEATGRDDRDLSEPWYGLYYDYRAEVVIFEDLKPGDVLELQYTVADVSAENAMADYFGDLQFIAETSPKRRWEYTLVGPAGRTFHFNEPRVAGLERRVETRGTETVHRFVARDVPRVMPEASMPGWAEVAPYLHVSTYRSWEDVGRWYWHLVSDQLTPDEAVRRAAREATAGRRTPAEKLRALHAFVVERTRYVGLEFGIHGYKPYKVSQVLSRKFGDCKDKASLLHALLKEVGIESELVLLRTRRGGRVAPAPASLAVFDHAITYVPSLDLYIDGTAEFAGVDELPYQDQGVTVLRVGPKGARLAETPVLPSERNVAARAWRVALDGTGGARIAEQVTITGQAAPEWREHYQTPGEQSERYNRVWNGRFPGASVESLDMAGIDDRNAPVRVLAEVTVPRMGAALGPGVLSFPITSREGELTRSYARLSRRRHDLQLAYPWRHEETFTFVLPDGWRVDRLPAPQEETVPFGRFRLEVTADGAGREVTVRSALDVAQHRITPDAYDGFRRFLRAVDGALAQRLVLRQGEGEP